MSGPLHGITIVEIGVWVAGPAAGGILADWGADVIKIEPPSGDPARTFRQILGGDLPTNPAFELDNRSKSQHRRRLPGGRRPGADRRADRRRRRIPHQLRGSAALERSGSTHETLCERHPSLVYALSPATASTGPTRTSRRTTSRRIGRGPVSPPRCARRMVQLPFQRGGMGDHSVAMTAAAMISAALVSRERNGQGPIRVDVAAAAGRVHRSVST